MAGLAATIVNLVFVFSIFCVGSSRLLVLNPITEFTLRGTMTSRFFYHFRSQSAVGHSELNAMREFYCKHQPMYWTINYGGEFMSGRIWESGRGSDVEAESKVSSE